MSSRQWASITLLTAFTVCVPFLTSSCGCGSAVTTDISPETVVPPRGSVEGGISVGEAFSSRRCVRSFADRALSPEQVTRLLWAAQGRSRADSDSVTSATRTAPSAGALHPLELYMLEGSRFYRYVPGSGELEEAGAGVDREAFAAASPQEFVGSAPAVLVIAADRETVTARYGDRAERYLFLEAGHAAQNFLLEAVSLGLGAVPVGAYDDDGVADALGLREGLEVLYLIPVGYPG